jgi:hypothetical protein
VAITPDELDATFGLYAVGGLLDEVCAVRVDLAGLAIEEAALKAKVGDAGGGDRSRQASPLRLPWTKAV